MPDADYAVDPTLLANTPAQAKSILKHVARDSDLYLNANKT